MHLLASQNRADDTALCAQCRAVPAVDPVSSAILVSNSRFMVRDCRRRSNSCKVGSCGVQEDMGAWLAGIRPGLLLGTQPIGREPDDPDFAQLFCAPL